MAEGRWRDLPPVEVPVVVPKPEIGQTFLRVHDNCDRAAYLHLLHEGGPGSHPLNRGSVLHRAAAKGTNLLIEQGESKLPPEVAKDLLLEVYAESPELTVPGPERNDLRGMMFNWAEGTFFDPRTIIGVEQSLSLDLGNGWIVRGKVDLIELPFRERVDVTDYKTSFNMPPQGEFEGGFQLKLYALLVAFGIVDGLGISLAPEAQEFGLKQVFPRYLQDDGLAQRYATIHRDHLLDVRLDLEAQLKRLALNESTGKWQPTPGPHCSECPSPIECPIPRQLRPDSQLAVANVEEAARLAEWWYVTGERVRRAKKRVKDYADRYKLGSIPVGRDLELAFIESEREEIIDKDELWIDVEGAVEFGHEFKREDHVRRRKATEFKIRKRPRDEET